MNLKLTKYGIIVSLLAVAGFHWALYQPQFFEFRGLIWITELVAALAALSIVYRMKTKSYGNGNGQSNPIAALMPHVPHRWWCRLSQLVLTERIDGRLSQIKGYYECQRCHVKSYAW